jgi:ribosomal protein S12 methylthiotransferase accessory factor
MCVRPNGRSLSVSQGKGLSDDLAQVSAVMESIESHHAEHIPPGPVYPYRTARRRFDVISPRRFQPGVRWQAYDDARPIEWAAGIDLASGLDVLVPRARLDLDWSRSHPDAGLLLGTSTGLASGNTRSEALCHALFEVVERDAEWRWNRRSFRARDATAVRVDSIEAPSLRGLLDRFAHARISASVWDMTSDVGIPTYSCSIGDADPFGGIRTFGGSGCHLSKEIALSRALTEAAQSRLTFIAGSRDDLFPDEYDSRVEEAAAGAQAKAPTADFNIRRSAPLGQTFDEDLTTSLELLGNAGFPRVIAVDHTRSEFGIPVVSVVVPGMREPETG